MGATSGAVRLIAADGTPLDVLNGVAVPAGQSAVLGAGSDGVSSRFILVDATGRQITAGAGVAGTPAGGVLSVQGVAGGTAQPISAASLPLPTGAATEATLATRAAATQLPGALVGGRLDTNLGAWFGAVTPTVGQKAMAASIPVTISLDQTPISVTSPGTAAGVTPGFRDGHVNTAVIALVPVFGAAYTEQSTDAQRSIVSTSANDSAAGTGARTVKITYMTAAGVGPLTETVALNGLTPVNTVATNICFIEHLDVVTVGSTGSNVGTLNLKAAVAGGGATITSVLPTDLQNFLALHYVPTGKTCYITGISVGHSGTTVGSGGLFTIRAQMVPVAVQPNAIVSDEIRLYGQSSTFARTYDTAIRVVGPARVAAYVLPETSTAVTYRAAIDFYDQ